MILLLHTSIGYSATISSSALGGNWNSALSWSGGTVPSATDDVIITSGATINLTTNQTCNSLTMNGSAVLNMNTNSRTLTITNNLTMNGTSSIQGSSTSRTVSVGTTFSVPASQSATIQNIVFTVAGASTVNGTLTFNTGNTAAKTFASVTISNTGTWTNTSQNVPVTIGGDLIVSGSGTFSQGTGRVTFTGASSNLVSCSNTVDFGGGITVNKGTSQSNVIDVQGPITMLSGGLILTNGTFKLSNAGSSITAFNTNPILTSTTQLWCNGGTISSSTLSFSGQVQVSAGTLNIGTTSSDYLFPDGGTLTISGTGALNVSGTISDFPVTLGAGFFFNMSGGTCSVGTGGSTFDDYAFAIGWSSNSTFNMSGGTIVVQNPQAFTGPTSDHPATISANTAGYYNQATTSNFTGGTLQMGNASSPSRTIGINTTKPIYNLSVNSSNVTAQVLLQAITVSNNVTLSSGTLNANNLDISAGGNWTNNGTFTPGTGVVTFNGTSALQTIGGSSSTSFYGLAFNNTSGLIPSITASTAATVTNALTMTAGIINLSGTTLSLGSGTAASLSRTSSTTTNWFYGGTLKRYWNNATAITSSSGSYYGLFPMGTSSASSYRPLEINSTANPTAAGTYSVTHTSATGVTDLSPTFNDGGITVQRIDNNKFVGAISGVAGGTYDINATMTGLSGTGNLTDLRLAVSTGGTTATAVGTHVAASGTVSNPTAKRTGASVTNLSNDFRIASSNSSATPLPIHLSSFTAMAKSEAVYLQWITATELNNDYFTMLRSSNGNDFISIGTVTGNGTTNTAHSYQLIDYNPEQGVNYYQLMQTDFDKNTSFSEVKSVKVNKELTSIYPNPVAQNQSLNVRVNGYLSNTDVHLEIKNSLGIVLKQSLVKTDNTGSIIVTPHVNLPPGLYFLVIQEFYYKFIVE